MRLFRDEVVRAHCAGDAQEHPLRGRDVSETAGSRSHACGAVRQHGRSQKGARNLKSAEISGFHGRASDASRSRGGELAFTSV